MLSIFILPELLQMKGPTWSEAKLFFPKADCSWGQQSKAEAVRITAQKYTLVPLPAHFSAFHHIHVASPPRPLLLERSVGTAVMKLMLPLQTEIPKTYDSELKVQMDSDGKERKGATFCPHHQYCVLCQNKRATRAANMSCSLLLRMKRNLLLFESEGDPLHTWEKSVLGWELQSECLPCVWSAELVRASKRSPIFGPTTLVTSYPGVPAELKPILANTVSCLKTAQLPPKRNHMQS